MNSSRAQTKQVDIFNYNSSNRVENKSDALKKSITKNGKRVLNKNRYMRYGFEMTIKNFDNIVDCGSCGGGGCHRCCSSNPDNIVDCGSCGGGGCHRCC